MLWGPGEHTEARRLALADAMGPPVESFLCGQHLVETYANDLTDGLTWDQQNSTPLPRYDAHTRITVENPPTSASAGQRLELMLRIHNLGNSVFSTEGLKPINIGGAVVSRDKKTVIQALPRIAIHPAILPKTSRLVRIQVPMPDTPGHYLLNFDLVQEGVFWFNEVNGPSSEPVPIEVR
jgi:hypothetical protein